MEKGLSGQSHWVPTLSCLCEGYTGAAAICDSCHSQCPCTVPVHVIPQFQYVRPGERGESPSRRTEDGHVSYLPGIGHFDVSVSA